MSTETESPGLLPSPDPVQRMLTLHQVWTHLNNAVVICDALLRRLSSYTPRPADPLHRETH